jgi:hypothetical protein
LEDRDVELDLLPLLIVSECSHPGRFCRPGRCAVMSRKSVDRFLRRCGFFDNSQMLDGFADFRGLLRIFEAYVDSRGRVCFQAFSKQRDLFASFFSMCYLPILRVMHIR